TEIQLPTGERIRQSWQDGLLQHRIDEAGHVTRYTYDSRGYPSRVELEDAVTGEITVDRFVYDGAGRLQRHEDPLGRVTTYDYTDPITGRSLDQPTRVTDPAGRTAVWHYDGNNNVIYERDFAGVETHTTYTPRGEPATRTIVMPDPDGGDPVTYNYRYEYDAENRLVRAEHPGNQVWTYAYDTRGNMVRSALDGTNIEQTFDYDATGRLRREDDGAGGVFEYDYLADGQLSTLRNPLGNQRQFGYDARGELQRIDDQGIGAQVVEFQHDALGRVIAET
ncbi:RHS repeat protein, partial [Natronospirillum operosum]